MAITLSRMWSYTVGGRPHVTRGQPVQRLTISRTLSGYDHDPNGVRWCGAAYVQAYQPAGASRPPLVLLPGGGLSGSIWESTPDGRDGWLTDFLHHGWPVHIVDPPERGRAGWNPYAAPYQTRPVSRTAEEIWTNFRIGRLGAHRGWADRVPFSGTRFPVQDIDAMLRLSGPRWPDSTEIAVAAAVALVDQLGPCVLIGHSHGGFAAEVAAARPTLVRACVLIEPHGTLAPPPAGTGPQLLVRGDFLDEDHLDQVPVYRNLVAAWADYRAAATRAGVRVDVLDLVGSGITGNTHMVMCDDNSHQVAALLSEWLDRCIGPRADDAA